MSKEEDVVPSKVALGGPQPYFLCILQMEPYQLPDWREGERAMPLGTEWEGKSHGKMCGASGVALEGSDFILVQPDTIVMASEHLSSTAAAKGQASDSGVCRTVGGGTRSSPDLLATHSGACITVWGAPDLHLISWPPTPPAACILEMLSIRGGWELQGGVW